MANSCRTGGPHSPRLPLRHCRLKWPRCGSRRYLHVAINLSLRIVKNTGYIFGPLFARASGYPLSRVPGGSISNRRLDARERHGNAAVLVRGSADEARYLFRSVSTDNLGIGTWCSAMGQTMVRNGWE